jgi:hypothetical protein
MALDPDAVPREALVILVAAGLRVFSMYSEPNGTCFDRAEEFVAEAEKRYGKLNK